MKWSRIERGGAIQDSIHGLYGKNQVSAEKLKGCRPELFRFSADKVFCDISFFYKLSFGPFTFF